MESLYPGNASRRRDPVTGGANLIIGGSGSNVDHARRRGGECGDRRERRGTSAGGTLSSVQSTAPGAAGKNTIAGPGGTPGGAGGGNIVIGGSGSNTIDIGGSNNTIIGADGEATFGAKGQILSAQSLDPANAGAINQITVTGGGDLIIGGAGANTTITATDGDRQRHYRT